MNTRTAFAEKSDPPAPTSASTLAWLRENFFYSPFSALITACVVVVLAWLSTKIIGWGIVNAVFTGEGSAPCRAAEGSGACWLLIREKFRLIMFGLYPYDQQWRPGVCIAIMLGMYVVSAQRRFWSIKLLFAWVAALLALAVLMWGGVLGLPFVHEDRWGGLPVTLMLATFGLAFAFPVAILIALARRAHTIPGLGALATVYVEVTRGVPMVTVLFMASVMFPLLLPRELDVSKLLRVFVAFSLFAAAYLSEVIRGGLQAIPKGQSEAAQALGLSYWRMTGLILLPQALRITIPSIVNTFIGFFKATAVVTVVGIYDVLTAAKRSVTEPQWQGFGTEAYLFVAVIYFLFCFAMSRYSQALEKRLRRGA